MTRDNTSNVTHNKDDKAVKNACLTRAPTKYCPNLRVASCLINVTRRPLETVDEPQDLAGIYLKDEKQAPTMRFSNNLVCNALDGRLINFGGLCTLNSFLHMLLDLKEKGFEDFLKILLQLTCPALLTILQNYQPPSPLPLFSETLRADLVARSFETLSKSKQETVLNDPRKEKDADEADLGGFGTERFVTEWLEFFNLVSIAETKECNLCSKRLATCFPSISHNEFKRIIEIGKTPETSQTKERCSLTPGCGGQMMSQKQISPKGFITSCQIEELVGISETYLEKVVPKICVVQGVHYSLTNVAIDAYFPKWQRDGFSAHAIVISFDKSTGQPKTLNDTGISHDYRAKGFFGRLELAVYTAAPTATEQPIPNDAAKFKEKSNAQARKGRKDLGPAERAADSLEEEQPHKMLTRAAARRLQQQSAISDISTSQNSTPPNC